MLTLQLLMNGLAEPEDRLFNFDFRNRAEIVAGQTIAQVLSVTAVPANELTIGTGVISAGQVQVEITGGVDGTTYRMACRVLLSDGKSKPICRGWLQAGQLV